MAKALITAGIILAGVGIIILIAEKFPDRIGWLGKLPGDFYIEKKNFKIYFPFATSLVISLILTILFWLFGKR